MTPAKTGSEWGPAPEPPPAGFVLGGGASVIFSRPEDFPDPSVFPSQVSSLTTHAPPKVSR